MRRQNVTVLALAIAACFPGGAAASEGDFRRLSPDETADRSEAEALPGLGAGISPAVLLAAGLAASAAILAGKNRGDGATASEGGASAASNPAPRTLSYTGAADFHTSEFRAQPGLQVVRADSLYYNGHYRWYVGDASHPAAGSGIGVKIAVADTGINSREGASASVIAIDAAASYDYVNDRAGSGADDSGHGTHVAGIIAAPKNGAGMHGLAYNASLVNFKVGDASGQITASDAQRADMISRAGNAGAMIVPRINEIIKTDNGQETGSLPANAKSPSGSN